jgi:uncharacterized membrane protein
MKKTIAALILLGMVYTASGTIVESENITVDLQEQQVEKEIRFKELTSNRMTYLTNHPVRNLEVTIEAREADCSFDEFDLGGEISCETDIYENFTTKISYDTSGLVTSQENINIFRYSQSIARPTNNYRLRVILPSGAVLVDEENVSTPVIYPERGEVGTEGRKIHVEWNQDPPLGETLNFEVVYENLDQEYNGYLVPSLIAAVIILSLIIGYRYRDKLSKVRDDSLPEDQQSVMKLLRENGDMLQKDIVDESEYSKAKISGLVSKLEEKDLIEKEKEGRSNRIKLKD